VVKVGDAVIYIDPVRKKHPALLTEVHGEENSKPAVNLIWVSDNPAETDPYGSQTKHECSCCHIDNNSAGANCWTEWA